MRAHGALSSVAVSAAAAQPGGGWGRSACSPSPSACINVECAHRAFRPSAFEGLPGVLREQVGVHVRALGGRVSLLRARVGVEGQERVPTLPECTRRCNMRACRTFWPGAFENLPGVLKKQVGVRVRALGGRVSLRHAGVGMEGEERVPALPECVCRH